MNFLLNPKEITDFHCSQKELELHILFWVLAAGKNGLTAAKCLNKLLSNRPGKTPFEIIGNIPNLPATLKESGIGCYRNKAETMRQLIVSGLDLATCSVDDLEKIKGIGEKSSRCFIVHTRRNQKYACLDRHVLNYMRDLGYNVPKSTPSGNKYKEIERQLLGIIAKSGKTASEFDLDIWRKYSGNDK